MTKSTHTHNVRKETEKIVKRRKITIGFHHGVLNPLPPTWDFPKAIPIIHLLNAWLIGDLQHNIPPFHVLQPIHVKHLKSGRQNLSKMKQVMTKIEELGKKENVWHSDVKHWTGQRVTVLWSSIWDELHPYLGDKTGNKVKSRDGQISWRTCYNKMQGAGLFKGNKMRKK